MKGYRAEDTNGVGEKLRIHSMILKAPSIAPLIECHFPRQVKSGPQVIKLMTCGPLLFLHTRIILYQLNEKNQISLVVITANLEFGFPAAVITGAHALL